MNNILIFCAGADKDLINASPKSEYQKIIGIGLIILMTGILASISGGYALYTIFKSPKTAVFFGLIWGFAIFNLDRYIVLSMVKGAKDSNPFLQALPRFLLAIVIAVVISRPLELKIFEPEVEKELTRMYNIEKTSINNGYERDIAKIDSISLGKRIAEQTQSKPSITEQIEIDSLASKVAQYKKTMDDDARNYRQESDGTGGTTNPGVGEICKLKEGIFKESQTAYNNMLKIYETEKNRIYYTKSKNDSLSSQIINKIYAETDSLKSERKKQKDAYLSEITKGNLGSFLDRNTALSNISSSNQAIQIVILFITLLFIILETAPVVVKLLTPMAKYDYLLLQGIEIAKHDYENSVLELKNEQIPREMQHTDLKIQIDLKKKEYELGQHFSSSQIESLSKKGKIKIDEWVNNKFGFDSLDEHLKITSIALIDNIYKLYQNIISQDINKIEKLFKEKDVNEAVVTIAATISPKKRLLALLKTPLAQFLGVSLFTGIIYVILVSFIFPDKDNPQVVLLMTLLTTLATSFLVKKN